MTLQAREVSFAVGARKLVDGVSLTLVPGQVHALLGPNGAGKSTLLKLLAGDLQPAAGGVELNGKPLMAWAARDRARLRAVLPQQDSLRFGFTVEEVVALGRLPCATHAPAREAEIVREALAATDATHLAGRLYPTLSGGERARVQFARVMAQLWEKHDLGDRFLLLDEPTASLDLSHQHACLKMVRCFAAGGVGVLVVVHDPNLAMSYADEVTLVGAGKRVATGDPVATLTADNLGALYGVPVHVHRPAEGERPVLWARP
jgi:iron complex transport system ATP-binding protein